VSNFGANHVQKGGQASSNNWCVGIFIQSSHVAFQYHTERCVTTEYSLAVLDIAFKELQPQDVAVEGWRMSRSISIVELWLTIVRTAEAASSGLRASFGIAMP